MFYALANGIYGTLPFLVLFQVGFLYTGLLSIVQQFGGDDMALRTQAAGESRAGLEDVVATSSAICFIDGDRGVLSYCGYDIHDLGAARDVRGGLLPPLARPAADARRARRPADAARRGAALPEPIVRLLQQLPPADGMDAAADADVGARALRPGRRRQLGRRRRTARRCG